MIWITCRTPGLFKDQCSPRSELVGIMAAFLVLEWMCQLAMARYSLASRPPVEVGCDGLCALQKSFSWQTLKSSAKHFDWYPLFRSYSAFFPRAFNRDMFEVMLTKFALIRLFLGGNYGIWKLIRELRPTVSSCPLLSSAQQVILASSTNLPLFLSTMLNTLDWTQRTSWIWSRLMRGPRTGLPRAA